MLDWDLLPSLGVCASKNLSPYAMRAWFSSAPGPVRKFPHGPAVATPLSGSLPPIRHSSAAWDNNPGPLRTEVPQVSLCTKGKTSIVRWHCGVANFNAMEFDFGGCKKLRVTCATRRVDDIYVDQSFADLSPFTGVVSSRTMAPGTLATQCSCPCTGETAQRGSEEHAPSSHTKRNPCPNELDCHLWWQQNHRKQPPYQLLLLLRQSPRS